MTEDSQAADSSSSFFFLKGGQDVIAAGEQPFDWERAATKVREHLNDAMNARHVAFLLGSGCSSFQRGGQELGIPTMAPLAKAFLGTAGGGGATGRLTSEEREQLTTGLGLDLDSAEFATNLERLMEVLYSVQFVLKHSARKSFGECSDAVESVIAKVIGFILEQCTQGPFANGDPTVLALYQAFYKKLIYRDRNLPRPWVFTTNYDLFNERAMDRLGIPYSNGFSGTVERRFNPATYRYALAEQLDVSSRKWTSVDSYIYLCKLHGSISWMEDGVSLFPVRELDIQSISSTSRLMIYPTPAKQSASFGYPYADLFREFQARIVREQSVLFVLGYSFGDEHINNIIFQALTIPTFRLIAFQPPGMSEVAAKLKALADPRIWLIGGEGKTAGRRAHYFDTFVESFMPDPPGDKVDVAVERILAELLTKAGKTEMSDDN